jgi:glycerophosphoryl diester phosphodiesterase
VGAVLDSAMMTIAHRHGNTVADLQGALARGVDLVECDVHAYRGRLDVRHLKTMGALPWLWDRDRIVRRRNIASVDLADVIDALGSDDRLMIDLKGVDRELAPRVAGVLRDLGPDRYLTVCTKAWWMLDAFDPPVRRVLSASNRKQLSRLHSKLAAVSAYGVSIRLSLLTADIVAALHRHTDVVMAWPVDTYADLARARQIGVDGIISKDLDLLDTILAQR